MMRTLFGQLRDGRIKRLSYLGYSLLVAAGAIILGIVVGFAVGAAEQLAGGDVQQLQAAFQENLGGVGVFLILLLCGALLFTSLNLMAKRLRDIGVPGWTTVAGVFLMEVVLSLVVSQQVASGFNLLVWLCLLLVPTGFLSRGRAAV